MLKSESLYTGGFVSWKPVGFATVMPDESNQMKNKNTGEQRGEKEIDFGKKQNVLESRDRYGRLELVFNSAPTRHDQRLNQRFPKTRPCKHSQIARAQACNADIIFSVRLLGNCERQELPYYLLWCEFVSKQSHPEGGGDSLKHAVKSEVVPL